MQMKDCLTALGKGRAEGGYLFYGEEEYLKEQALGQLRKLLLAPGMELMDEQTVEGEISLADCGRLVDTPPFMSPRRLVIVREDPRFDPGVKTTKEDKAQVEALARRLGEMSTLVFYRRGAIAATQPWLKLLDGLLTCVNFAPVTAREAAPWIRRMAKQAGLTLADGAAEYLFEYVGGLLRPVETEIAKLAAYCRDVPAGRDAIEAVCVQAVEHKVFVMMDDLIAGRSGPALVAYHGLVQDGEAPAKLLVMLAGQLRVWARAGDLAGMTSAEAAKALGCKPFVLDKALRRGAAGRERYRDALRWCAEADAAFKSGRMQEETAVEQLVMRLAYKEVRGFKF